MSYNIDSIEVLTCGAWMVAEDVRRLSKLDDLPESCFLEEMANKEPDTEGRIPIDPEKFWWCGEGSGHAWENVFVPRVAPKIHGLLEAVLTWEGGDSHGGLRIRDGKVTQPKVKMTLEDE